MATGWLVSVFTTTLTCSPAGGGEEWYLDPELACGDFAAAGGDLSALPGRPLDCAGARGPAIRFTPRAPGTVTAVEPGS